MEGRIAVPVAQAESGKQGDALIRQIDVAAYRVPTDVPEADGTFAWDATTIVVVHAYAGDVAGVGYSYAHAAATNLIATDLANAVEGLDAFQTAAAWDAMLHACRNLGQSGLASYAIAAVDCALWDLKARLLEVPLASLLGQVRRGVPLYGSGGFTSYDVERLTRQLTGWVESGIPRVKMKVGQDPSADPARVRSARQAIGDEAELFVDANGAYSVKQALALGRIFSESAGVTWFEEPRPSDDLDGLRTLREEGPEGLEVAAGEYACLPWDFRRLIEASAVDCVQADVTRCCGITGFLKAAAQCEAALLPLSAHCAPQLHAHVGCAAAPLRHVEYFHDHVRIEHLLFDGVLEPVDGELRPALSRPGMGLTLKRQDAAAFAI